MDDLLVRICLITLSLLYFTQTLAQDGIVVGYYGNGNLESEVSYIKEIKDGPARFYYENGNLKSELEYNQGELFGLCREYYENGALKEEALIKEGKRDGLTKLYYDNGGLKAILKYDEGVLISKQDFDRDPYLTYTPPPTPPKTLTELNARPVRAAKRKNPLKAPNNELPPTSTTKENEPDFYLAALDTAAQPIGGMRAIYRNLKYPELAERANVEGEVTIRLYINEYGAIDKSEIVKGIGMGCDEAALDAVNKAVYKPGKFMGKSVKSQIVIPVEFKKKEE